MTPRKYSKTRKSRKGTFIIGGLATCAIAVLVVCVGLNVSFAGAGSTNASTFGLTETSEPGDFASQEVSDLSAGDNSLLTSSASRNIDQAIDEMLAIEEAERIAEEEARLAAEAAKQAEIDALAARADADAAAAGLEVIDWNMDRETFISHWTARIDAYLAGSPLSGYGVNFATAAWEYGVDPRLSPAISNTESSKGSVCFKSHNAWGWGQSSWGSWEQAIDAHISGLANGGYAPMMTYSDAVRYCPTNLNWYTETVSEMRRI